MGLASVHPDLRSAARWIPTWMPGLGSRRALDRVRALAGRLPVRTFDGVGQTTLEHGILHRAAVAVDRPGPTVLWIHGGGLVLGRAADDGDVAAMFVREAGASVLAVDYRLAPDHPAPAAIDDCFAALAWLQAQPWVDPARIVVGGASAGGGLAAALAQRAYDAGIGLAGQLLVYPMLDDRTCLREPANTGEHRLWTNRSNRFGWSSYLGMEPGAAEVPSYSVPARRADLTGLAPAWIGVGGSDLFLEEDLAYAERLRAAGVPCATLVAPGAFHGFDRIAAKAPVSQEFAASQVAAVRSWVR